MGCWMLRHSMPHCITVTFSGMKYFVLIAIAGVWLTACKDAPKEENTATPQTYERVENYGTGETSRRFNIVNGKKEGKMTDYFPTGEIMAERWFADNQQEGKTTIFFKSGAVKEVQYYQGGKKFRGDTLFYENGKIEFATDFKEGKKNGYLRKWSPEGALVYEARFEMDSLVEVKGQKLAK